MRTLTVQLLLVVVVVVVVDYCDCVRVGALGSASLSQRGAHQCSRKRV